MFIYILSCEYSISCTSTTGHQQYEDYVRGNIDITIDTNLLICYSVDC
jgi:hypothetical protein